MEKRKRLIRVIVFWGFVVVLVVIVLNGLFSVDHPLIYHVTVTPNQ